MEFYSLDNLKRDVAQNNLYNLFDATFKYLTNITLQTYIVNKFHEMRIDSVCKEIYKGETKYCDFLLDLNNIDNPLNIMEDDILLYVSPDQINYFQLDETTAKTLRNTYLNANKVSTQDPNRTSYIQNNYSLPPTFLEIPSESVVIRDGKIILGGNS
jgi:hypothetical protein